jgi:hypothetical protein
MKVSPTTTARQDSCVTLNDGCQIQMSPEQVLIVNE